MELLGSRWDRDATFLPTISFEGQEPGGVYSQYREERYSGSSLCCHDFHRELYGFTISVYILWSSSSDRHKYYFFGSLGSLPKSSSVDGACHSITSDIHP